MKIRRGDDEPGDDGIVAAAGEASLPVNIPYGFAKRFGVALLGEQDGHLAVVVREGADPRTLIEVRRFLSRPFDVQFAPADKFDRILSERYAMDGQAAADAAGSLGLGDDLSPTRPASSSGCGSTGYCARH